MPGIKTLAKAALDRTSLGNLIVHEGLLDQNELDEFLAEFRRLRIEELFGQFLMKKGVLSEEKLELLLIRQSAIREGGANRGHVKQAIGVAHRTSQRIMNDVEEFMAETQAALAEVGEDT